MDSAHKMKGLAFRRLTLSLVMGSCRCSSGKGASALRAMALKQQDRDVPTFRRRAPTSDGQAPTTSRQSTFTSQTRNRGNNGENNTAA